MPDDIARLERNIEDLDQKAEQARELASTAARGTELIRTDVLSHARILTEHNAAIARTDQIVAVMVESNKHRDEKLNSILSLGRTILVAVILSGIGAVSALIFK